MIRRRAVLALTADMDDSDENRWLLSVLEELGRAGAIDPARTRVVAGEGGELTSEVARAADLAAVRVVGAGADRAGQAAARLHPAARSVGERVGLGWGLVRHPARTVHGPPDVVWAEGVGALPLADALPRPARRAPLVVHLPEGAVALDRAVGGDAATRLARARLVVVASRTMRTHLVDDLGIAPSRVSVQPPWLVRGGSDPAPSGIPDDALVVAGMGPVGWRGGTDLFLDVAARLPTEVDGRPLHLAWCGTADDPTAADRTATDIRLRGLDDRVHLAGAWAALDPDVAVVTARESPVPLRALRCAQEAIPVVGFAGAGLEDVFPATATADAVAPAFDAAGLADRVAALVADPVARRSLGAEQAAHVSRRHVAATRVGELWADIAAQLARG